MLVVFSCIFSSTGGWDRSGAPLSRPQAGGSFGPSQASTLSQAYPRATFILQHSRHLARDRASSWSMTDHARNSSTLFQDMPAKPRPHAPCIADVDLDDSPTASKLRAYLRAHLRARQLLSPQALQIFPCFDFYFTASSSQLAQCCKVLPLHLSRAMMQPDHKPLRLLIDHLLG
jgi:hypothetical protein